MTILKKMLGAVLALALMCGFATPVLAEEQPKLDSAVYIYYYDGYGPSSEQRVNARVLTADDLDIIAYLRQSCDAQRKKQEPNAILDATAEVATSVLGNIVGTFAGATKAYGDAIDVGRQVTYSGSATAGSMTANVFTNRTKGTRSEIYSCMVQMRGWAEQFDHQLVGVGFGHNPRLLGVRPIKRADLPAGPAQQPTTTGYTQPTIPGS